MNTKLSFLHNRVTALGLLGLLAACGDAGTDELGARELSPGEPPLVEILRPADGEVFSVGRDIPLDCDVQAADPDASVTIDWSGYPGGSGPAVFLSDHASSSTADLEPGVHQIVCTASHGDLQNNDLVTITVTNDAPVVTIVNPDHEGDLAFFASQDIAYDGSVVDADLNADLADLHWEVRSTSGGPVLHSGEGQQGTIPAGTLEPGEYQLMAYILDELGEPGSAWLIFDVVPSIGNHPPVISDPRVAATPIDPNDVPPTAYYVEQCLVDINGDGYHDGDDQCQRLTISATVNDDHDPREDLIYEWTVLEGDTVIDTFTTPSSVTQLDFAPSNFGYALRLVAEDTMGAVSRPHWFRFFVVTLN